ncbi:MAG: choloylglycine hydrolase [Alistipes sp.]|nr:choloylglycine hydrolase [Alistipes sp.]
MRKTLKIIALCVGLAVAVPLAAVVLLSAGAYALYATRDFKQPTFEVDLSALTLAAESDSLRICGDNSLLLDRHGLWEARISGSAAERGAVLGVMAGDLIRYQEDVFVGQIHELIPSERYVGFLHKVVMLFNRRMAYHIPEELRDEIYALSSSCSDRYDDYGTPYVRQLNYHAAHDIGHTMQEYMLVGCSSFAVRGEASADGGLVIGRNFDFYAGDDFARNKLVLFMRPDNGYAFASVAWPGMMGVVSGMNEKGLTVTINAAKGKIPLSAAMPVSLLARMILQYAGNIGEALQIAESHRMFISESLLIGSAVDGEAAIIEKSPERTELFRTAENRLVCTNHFQSAGFADDPYNVRNIAESDSPYRYRRLTELLESEEKLTVEGCARVLRDRFGKGGADIGLGNEKSINQFMAHHSVIFQPERLKMWVSTSPWQSGEFVCYDLHEVFGSEGAAAASFVREEETVAADSLFLARDYDRLMAFREQSAVIRNAVAARERVTDDYIDNFASLNPEYFGTWDLCGDRALSAGDRIRAVQFWRKALSKEIPRLPERAEIEKKIKKYDTKQRTAL